ncbi:cytochrome c oxidase assembly factor CtaG [Bacillus sp. FJAT-42376]|uniref:cytochrome c oxidase assembly factor CtaG n=1 Tax=Bacillus sp. FJAT-42376 TaxID=2014076 RepID=UPI000F4FC764|nr:cytochrome c oxidase assembly factor CtaG [Bacillus sp. FJAT-42376]AZB42805.1 cytochrome c oxidase assembly factor CtaG [Bacillus sp. FJAT-42376]
MENLTLFGFEALWSPYYLTVLALLSAGYFLAVRNREKWFRKSRPVNGKQQAAFYGGMALLYILKGSPIDLLGHILFSVHMFQMAMVYLVVSPLLIIGIPIWMWDTVLKRSPLHQIFSFLTKPVLALIVFNGIFSLYHTPLVFDLVKTNPAYHAAASSVIFFTSICMWWPVFRRRGNSEEMSGLMKMGYIFANGVLLTPACALIIFAKDPLYAAYSDPASWMNAMALCVPGSTLTGLNLTGPEVFTSMPLTEDQQLGGIIMKIIQEAVYGTILGFVFFQWVRKEREKDQQELQVILSNK